MSVTRVTLETSLFGIMSNTRVTENLFKAGRTLFRWFGMYKLESDFEGRVKNGEGRTYT